MADSSVFTPKRRLEGKVAIVTGGASGIGATTVRVFVENGANVVIADIQDPLGQQLASQLGENVHYIHCDVSKEEDMSNLINKTVSIFGHLDIMYNNAGIYDISSKSIFDTETIELERKLAVNVVGSFLGAKYAAKVMVPRKQGCILFTASSCTEVAGVGSHTYAASKYGVVGLCKNLAAELGLHGIRVNCISPFAIMSSTSTNKVDNKELEKQYEAFIGAVGNLKGIPHNAEDVANAAVYLASDEGKYISGHNLVIDGGFSVVNPSILNIKGFYT